MLVNLIFLRFLYQLYIAIDANFKLKAKNRGAKAVNISDGYAYFVQDADYVAHLSKNTDDMKEVRSVPVLSFGILIYVLQLKHCSSEHNALRAANMPAMKCFIVNGVGAAICARHLLYRAQGVVDLPRGERYVLIFSLCFC
jgi:hypothetical protein